MRTCPVGVRGQDGTDLHEEGPQRVLEGSDGTERVGKGGLEMGQDVCRRPLPRCRRQLGRWTAPRQCRADLALAAVEPLPDALQGSVAQVAVDGADGGADAAGDGAMEKAPQGAGGQAEASDLVGAPDAKRSPATAAGVAVAAKEPPGTHGLAPGAAVVIAAQIAVLNQRADHLAMRAGRLLKPFGQRDPFVDAAEEPALVAHAVPPPRKAVILPAWESGGVVAGYEKAPEAGCGVC